jgi:hypothetical protein
VLLIPCRDSHRRQRPRLKDIQVLVSVPTRFSHALLTATLLAAVEIGGLPFVTALAFGADPAKEGKAPAKPRLLVLTDIGGDPDDQQSMIRLMTYANEFDIEGLIASASGTPGVNDAVTHSDLIREIVGAYGKVRPNLLLHRPDYPRAESLLDRVKSGNPRRGVRSVGADHDTDGSRWIVRAADRDDARPLNIVIWGGSTDLAQALWRVRNDRTAEGLKRFVGKLRVHAIGHQDDTGPWIVEQFPDLFYVLSKAPEKHTCGRAPTGACTSAGTSRSPRASGWTRTCARAAARWGRSTRRRRGRRRTRTAA